MQRDMELVRKLLIVLADHEHGFAPRKIEVGGFTDERIGYHVWLMWKGGLIEGVETTVSGSPSPQALPVGLTWEGHDFLEAARNESIWRSALEKAKAAGVPLTIAGLKTLLEYFAKHQLGL